MRDLRLTPAARRDLGEIWSFTARAWSAGQADAYLRALAGAFDALAAAPEMARERTEFDPPVRVHPFRAHLVIYRAEADHVAVIRVVHARRDWAALLGG